MSKAMTYAVIYTYSKIWANFKAVTLLWRNIFRHSMEQQDDAISVWISCSCQNCCLCLFSSICPTRYSYV